ncbi:unnamed protein product [Adineta ricciae]|uniref:Uncharacterized protein n=1 Tax=Adineta ricciae TaxID=249248 RepID=A0A815F5P6_ADIRI|nr:unnamed protein product [Adineta ricciae]
MHPSRRSGPVTDLHNAHTVSTLMRTMTTSTLPSQRSQRHSSRSRLTADGTFPVRSSSIHQMDSHDHEYERPSRTFDAVRSADLLALEIKLSSNEKVIAHQNAQIEMLRETNRTLERRLHELSDLKRDLSNKQYEERLKNDDLLRDLHDIDRLARKVQADKQYTVDAADRELTEAKMEIEQNHREMQALDTRLVHLSTDKKSLIEELAIMKNQFADCNNELLHLQDIVDRLQADKGKLSRRVSKLVQNEKELLYELQRCRRTTKPPTPSASGGATSKKLSLPARLEIHLRNIEDERDMYKNEVEILQKLLNNHPRCVSSSSPSSLRGRSLSPSVATRGSGRRDTATSPMMHLIKRSASSISTSPTRCTVCGINRNRLSPAKDVNPYETQLRNVEDERDRFRRELHKYKRSTKDKDSTDAQLSKALREKEDLQLLLNKFERHMAEIQGNIKVLTNERDSTNILYEQAKEDLQKARLELLQNSQTPKVSLAAQSILRKVENERDSALVEARAAASERDSLRERLRVATDAGLTERARNEQRIEDLEVDLRKLEHDREQIIQQNHSLREQIRDLENQLSERSFAITQLNQELDDQKSASAQLRYLSEEAERLVQENQRQLNLKKDELRAQEEKIIKLEKKIYELQEANKALKDDFLVVRNTVQTLDKEKEHLCGVIDLRADENLRLTQEINAKIRRIEELNRIVSELESALDRTNEDAKQKSKEITTIRIQIDRNAEESSEYRRKLELSLRDNARLQDELLNTARDNQKLRQDFERAVDDKESLKLQIQEYIKQVSNCDNIIAQKENDRTTLIEQYREASNELSRAKLTLADIESHANDLKQELQTKSADIKRLTERINFLERDVHHHATVGQEYEIQLSNMNRSLQRSEEIIKKLQSDKQDLLTDVNSIRDHNSSIESKKEQIMRQLTSIELENDQLRAINGDMKIEIDMLRTQISNEKAVVQSLEELINSLREKEFQAQINAKERESELHIAKDRANLSDLKVHTQSKEVAALRTQILGLESDIKRLKSSLSNERHEKEMAMQDLRRLNDRSAHIEYDSRYRSASPRITTSTSNTNLHRSPARSRSPSHSDSSPTKSINRTCSLCVNTTA